MNLSALTETGPRCVHFASVAQVAAFLEHPRDLAVFHLRGAELRSEAELLAGLAHAMAFPPWFAYSLDALEGCLRDLAWHPACGYLLIVWDAETGAPGVLRRLREAWQRCAPFWHSPDGSDVWSPPRPTPFHLVLVGQEERVFPPSEGGT
ncbi:barstar family protein [Deinococcus planocerae]|uniref:barstar family protein n=1 Tax=Deinococcus planocerae TaxID=1737569 RepID=UPI000C7F4EEF|nr:barstar family protein [Deinococcus planocerae]